MPAARGVVSRRARQNMETSDIEIYVAYRLVHDPCI